MKPGFYFTVSICLLLQFAVAAHAETTKEISIETFIQTATQNDTRFEEILMDKMPLQYRRDAILPTRDLIVSLKHQFHLYLNGIDAGASSSISLQQLFPDTGTTASASFSKNPSYQSNGSASLQLLVSQPIAKNAFGHNFKLQDQLIGVENDITRYQIVEAYEDYLAGLTTAWYNWYSAYENLLVSRASLSSSEKLLDNILERQRQKIALQIDVNKMKLSLIRKRENQIILENTYREISTLIASAMRLKENGTRIIPSRLKETETPLSFETDYARFVSSSRTYELLNLLENKTTLEVKRAADDLLPSTQLLLGYQLDAQDWGLSPQQNSFFAGISMDWPVKHSSERARHKIATIERKKTALSHVNKYEELRTNLSRLFIQIEREKELMRIAKTKIQLAEDILRDESENYSFGKVSLNDYIDAVNDVDENRFSFTEHQIKLNKLIVEWKRLTDTLVDARSPEALSP